MTIYERSIEHFPKFQKILNSFQQKFLPYFRLAIRQQGAMLKMIIEYKVIITITTYNQMNINFIRNLSDEILRENQQLKTEIIIVKQKILDYQEQMINAISSINHNLNILNNPSQLLKDFTKWTRELYYENRQLKQERVAERQSVKSLHLQIKMLQQQCICKDSQLQIEQQKELRLKEQNRTIVETCELQNKKLIENNDQLSKQLIQLKEQMRLQKMMLVQTKRKQIQEMRQYHLKQFLQFRQKSDREVVFIQKQMQQQLIEKDKMIKSLQTAIEKVSKNLKLDDNQSDTLIKLLKSFQEYNHLSKIVQERSQEIYKFRQQLQEQEYARIKLESKVKQIGMNQMNLLSQLERANIEKRDLQNKLQAKSLNLVKSQQDKEAMEQYYDKKWNQQYKKVKTQLEKAYSEKFKTMEQECVKKEVILTKKVEESQKQLKAIQTQNVQLQSKMDQSKEKLEETLKRIQVIQKNFEQLKRQKAQLQLMTSQEILQMKNAHSDSKQFYENQLQNLNSMLSVKKEIFDDIKNQHKKQIQQCQRVNKIELQKIISQKQSEKKIIQLNCQKEIIKLQKQIQIKQLFIQDVKSNVAQQIEKQINRKWQQAHQNAQVKLRQKQQQMTKKNDKWMVKYKQVDIKYTQLKKKHEEDQQNFKKEINKVQLQNQIFKNGENKYHAQMKQFMTVKSQLLIKQGQLQKKITQLNNQIKNRQQQKCSLQDTIGYKNNEISILKSNRYVWLAQVSEVQKSYKQEFDNLKKINDKQNNLLKSKIWQLQEMIKKRPINRKDYERIQQLDKQRKMLKNQVYIKQAENIILSQVKDYYQSKLKESQKSSIEQENNVKIGSALMGFKLKMLKKNSHKQAFTEAHQSKDMIQMKKYIVKSAKKTKNSLTKMKFEEMDHHRYHRFNTTHQ